MSKDIEIAESRLPAANTPQTVFSHTGDNGLQIANSGTVNIYLPGSGGTVATPISTEYYNLFVVSDETFNESFFLMGKDRVLEGVAPEISEQFSSLTTESIAMIKTFPSLFASENRYYGRTDDDHFALFGVVTDVKVQENGVKIYFQRFCSVPQQRLNEIAFSLAIQGKPSFNEFNRTHWAIKRIHLVEELRAAGISVLLPT